MALQGTEFTTEPAHVDLAIYVLKIAMKCGEDDLCAECACACCISLSIYEQPYL